MEAVNFDQYEKNLAENQWLGGYPLYYFNAFHSIDNSQLLLIEKLMNK